MIERIRLIDFYSHKDSDLELVPGINVFTGPSANGKTSILRGFYWVNFNRPSNKSYIRHGQESSSVIITQGGKEITRSRDKDSNQYIIDGVTLGAVNRDVPEEVGTFFNLSEAAIQKQMDGPFLLFEEGKGGAEIARLFNKIANLEKIDELLSLVDKDKRKVSASIKHNEEEDKRLKEELSNWDWVDSALELLDDLKQTEVKIKQLSSKKTTLQLTKDQYQSYSNQTEIKFNTARALELIQDIHKIEARVSDYKRSISNYQYNLQLYRIEQITFRKAIFIGEVAPIIKEWESLNHKIEPLRIKQTGLTASLNRYGTTAKDNIQYRKQLRDLEKQLPETCPVCGGKL